MPFTTYDRDNDQGSKINCAEEYKGAWWYNHCYYSNLNGLYLPGPNDTNYRSANWFAFNNNYIGLKYIEMKMELQ